MAQRDTTAFQIARANELSKLIDASATRPDNKIIWEFNGCVSWLQNYNRKTEQHGLNIEIDELVRFPENW